jgi:Mrp family chromosome partitioning ATPase
VLLFAEALSLSNMVDGVVFLVKEGLASMENIKDALAALRGADVLGIVYNGLDQENLDTRYRYSSYDRYKQNGVQPQASPAGQ